MHPPSDFPSAGRNSVDWILIAGGAASNRRNLRGDLSKYRLLMVRTVGTAEEAAALLRENRFDLVLFIAPSDPVLGVRQLAAIAESDDCTAILVAVSSEMYDAARRAAFDDSRVRMQVDERIAFMRRGPAFSRDFSTHVFAELGRQGCRRAGHAALEKPPPDGIVGISTHVDQVRAFIWRASGCDAPVVLEGKCGTGKELVARAIHDGGIRGGSPFEAVNCGIISQNRSMLADQLFGHEKGAFTGADSLVRGLFERADGGTLLLDEIQDLHPEGQVGLLRVLQEGVVTRVGGQKAIAVDVRVVAASNADLETEVAAERFRDDLWYRLDVLQLRLLPLRDRAEDIPPLVRHMVTKYASKSRKEIRDVEPQAMQCLRAYAYPGNIRELDNIIRAAVTQADADPITVSDLKKKVRERLHTEESRSPLGRSPVDQAKCDLAERYWRKHNGNYRAAAAALQVSVKTLKKWLGLDQGGKDHLPDSP